MDIALAILRLIASLATAGVVKPTNNCPAWVRTALAVAVAAAIAALEVLKNVPTATTLP